MPEGQGISRRREMPSPSATAHPNLGLGLDGRGRTRMRGMEDRRDEGGGRSAGGKREMRHEGGELVEGGEAHLSRPSPRSSRASETTPLFPGDFGAFGVGNDPSYGWNSGCKF
jgi:hypothetical protein